MECLVTYWESRQNQQKEIRLTSLEEALKFAGFHPGAMIRRAEDLAYYDLSSGEFIRFKGFS